MALINFADLTKGKGNDDIQADILAALADPTTGFPISSWDVTGTALGLIKGFRLALVSAWNLVPVVASGQLLRYADAATGWLATLGDSNYDTQYRYATKATRRVRLMDVASVGPVTRDARSSWIVDSNGQQWINVNPIMVPLNGAVYAVFEGGQAGTSYNATSAGWSWVTTIAGVTVDEPTGMVLVSPGTDDEAPDVYRSRCKGKWYTIAPALTDDGYKARALEASPLVTRVLVQAHTPVPGSVTLTIAGADVLTTPTDTTVQTYIQKRAPNTVDVYVALAVSQTISVTGTVYAVASELDAELSKAVADIAAWQASIPIGGGGYGVSREQLERKIMGGLSDDPKNDLGLSTPATDVALSPNAIPHFDLTGLTWVAR